MSTRVVHFPFASRNPFQENLLECVRPYGVSSDPIPGGLKGLLRAAVISSADILHLHWVTSSASAPTAIGSLVRFLVFISSISLWRLRGKKIVWTVHNIVNHENRRIWLDLLISRYVGGVAERVLVQGESARQLAVDRFHLADRKVLVIYHGNYASSVRASPPREDRTGVRFLHFGMIRPYKGVPELMRSFRDIQGPHELRIVGEVKDEALRREIEELACSDRRIILALQYIPDESLEALLAWCDVVVLPYRHILTSGSLLFALSAGRPVVAPRQGLIQEYAGEGCGFLYCPNSPTGLGDAMRSAVQCENLGQLSTDAFRRSMRFDWSLIGERLAQVYTHL